MPNTAKTMLYAMHTKCYPNKMCNRNITIGSNFITINLNSHTTSRVYSTSHSDRDLKPSRLGPPVDHLNVSLP